MTRLIFRKAIQWHVLEASTAAILAARAGEIVAVMTNITKRLRSTSRAEHAMKIKYDRRANAASIYLAEIEPGGVAFTYACDPVAVRGMINLDIDKEGRLIKIGVIDAASKIPKELLESAE